jgi:hypothetical protein
VGGRCWWAAVRRCDSKHRGRVPRSSPQAGGTRIVRFCWSFGRRLRFARCQKQEAAAEIRGSIWHPLCALPKGCTFVGAMVISAQTRWGWSDRQITTIRWTKSNRRGCGRTSPTTPRCCPQILTLYLKAPKAITVPSPAPAWRGVVTPKSCFRTNTREFVAVWKQREELCGSNRDDVQFARAKTKRRREVETNEGWGKRTWHYGRASDAECGFPMEKLESPSTVYIPPPVGDLAHPRDLWSSAVAACDRGARTPILSSFAGVGAPQQTDPNDIRTAEPGNCKVQLFCAWVGDGEEQNGKEKPSAWDTRSTHAPGRESAAGGRTICRGPPN